MVNMIAARVRASDVDGLTETRKVKECVFECHFENCKRQILEAMPTSSLEQHVRQILDERETAYRQKKRLESEADGGPQGKLLPAKEVYHALFAAKHLHLTRQQLLAVMSLQDECLAKSAEFDEAATVEGQRFVDVTRFAAEASVLIADFFDVGKLKQRALLASSVKANSEELLKGMRQDEIEETLSAAFKRLDDEGKGALNMDDFRTVIQGLTALDLSKGEISAVLTNAPCDEDGLILWEDFLLDSHEIFLMLAHERQRFPA